MLHVLLLVQNSRDIYVLPLETCVIVSIRLISSQEGFFFLLQCLSFQRLQIDTAPIHLAYSSQLYVNSITAICLLGKEKFKIAVQFKKILFKCIFSNKNHKSKRRYFLCFGNGKSYLHVDFT